MLSDCINPQVILNPRFKDLVLYSRFIVTPESNISITTSMKCQLIEGVNPCKVFRLASKVANDSIDKYIIVGECGDSYPVYIEVGCGKCVLCRDKKVRSYVQRCQFESLSHTLKPWFVTLTYNEFHLPDHGVTVRDVQLFKKRFNKCVRIEFGDSVRMKYLIFSEYGVNGRPHYHCMLFGIPPINGQPEKILKLHTCLNFAWREPECNFESYKKRGYSFFNRSKPDKFSYGFVDASEVQSSSCIGYVTKYIGKTSNVPEGKNNNFSLVSHNFGVEFAKSLRPYILKSYDSAVDVYDPFTGKITRTRLTSYFVKKLFPSYSVLCPKELRDSWIQFWYSSDILMAHALTSNEEKRIIVQLREQMRDKFSFFNYTSLVELPHRASFDDTFDAFISANDYLNCFNLDSFDYEKVVKSVMERDLYISRFDKTPPETVLKRVQSLKNYNSIINKRKI